MNLQELLESFELSADQIAEINKSVDTVIESKLSGQADSIKALEDELTATKGDLKSANEELAPVRDAAKKEQLASLMPESADPDKHEDIVALAGLSDEDDEDTIKSKLQDTVDKRDYLQKPQTEDKSAGATSTDKTGTAGAKEDESEKDDSQEMPAGVK